MQVSFILVLGFLLVKVILIFPFEIKNVMKAIFYAMKNTTNL
ncbi:hypothetical protein RC62_1817 [Flavobacterium aquidurense]|uniref:Uncharacterized protein n=1 Tax=Flavobacterium aquidurense TaxID=362413 RepID=A0A0Q0S537_9FLAO|nr:hypothetical protein RC62_1817 [Flavobacterium aquidurense]